MLLYNDIYAPDIAQQPLYTPIKHKKAETVSHRQCAICLERISTGTRYVFVSDYGDGDKHEVSDTYICEDCLTELQRMLEVCE